MNDKKKAALGSIAASAALTVAKAVVGVMTGSLAILSEAGHSLLDLAATVLTYAAVRVSGKPADAEHQYGHGKIESVAALAETALLFILAVAVAYEAGSRLLGGQAHAVEATPYAFAIIGVSILVDFFRARTLERIAEKTASQALEADALHFSSDMWSSIAVLIGLGGVALDYAWADSAAALIVAIFICVAGWRLGQRTIDTLTDTAPAGVSEKVAAIARRVPGIVEVERVRARPGGAVLFVDLAVGVSRTLPLDRVTAIKDRLARAIRAEFPEAETTITTEPRALDDETVRERVMLIARNSGLAVHHVAVQAIGDRLSVSADLEVDGMLPLSAAHETASRLEEAIREELGPEVEVETHIEPLPAAMLAGRDADAAHLGEIREALTVLAGATAELSEVHDVRVRETADGEIVNFHCQVDPALSVRAVHDLVDGIERGLRRRFPTIARVIGHAEPRRGS
jgi:cation diffusion facilitator family transporter